MRPLNATRPALVEKSGCQFEIARFENFIGKRGENRQQRLKLSCVGNSGKHLLSNGPNDRGAKLVDQLMEFCNLRRGNWMVAAKRKRPNR